MDRLYSSNAGDAERIRAMILFDDVSDDDSIDDAKESDENYVEPRESNSECAEHGTPDGYSCTEVDATDSCCHWKRLDEVRQGKCSTHLRRRWRNVLTKLPGVISQARKAATPFEAWNYLITNAIRGDTVQHKNQYIIQPKFSRASDAKLR